MRRIMATIAVAMVLLITGCGSDDDNSGSAGTDQETIVNGMALQSDGDTWMFHTAEGESCTVEALLLTPVEVQDAENAGDVVAVNAAGSFGVQLPSDESDSCYDAATDLIRAID